MKTLSQKIMAFAIMLLSVSISALADNWTDPSTGITWTYKVLTKTTASIGGGTSSSKAVSTTLTGGIVIPETINDTYTVTTVGNYAFSGCTGLTSIEIPNSVKTIGSYAFQNCTGLTSIEIPNSVTSLGTYSFQNCTGLNSVLLSNTLSSLGDYTFDGCANLAAIEFPNALTTLGTAVFRNCTSLAEITVTNSLYNIGISVFKNTAWENNLQEGLNYLGLVAYKYIGTMPEGTTIEILEDTKGIAAEAFRDCTGLTSIEIPNSVKIIGSFAFSGCTGLTSIEIPNSISNINNYTFQNCYSLTEIQIPNNITSIGLCGFIGCTGLTSIEIPNSVKTIGSSAFSGCTSLGEISGCGSVTNIGNDAFAFTIIKKLSFPSLTSINNSILENSIVEEINIPNITAIGVRAFAGAKNLKHITLGEKLKTLEWSAFQDAGIVELNIPKSCKIVDTYKNSSEYPENRMIAHYLTAINVDDENPYHTSKDGILYNKDLTQLQVFPALKETENMYYYVPESVTSTRNGAFEYSILEYIEFENKDTKIAARSFAECRKLKRIKLPRNITLIPNQCFYNCIDLAEITIPSKVTNIAFQAFWGCTQLTEITIPSKVTNIASQAFGGCTQLKSVYCMPTTAPKLYDYATFQSSNEWLFNKTLYVKTSALNSYKEAYIWKSFKTITDMIPIIIGSGKNYATLSLDYDADFSETEGVQPYIANKYLEGKDAWDYIESFETKKKMSPAMRKATDSENNNLKLIVLARYPNGYVPSRTGDDYFDFHGTILYGKPGTYYFKMGEQDFASDNQITVNWNINYMKSAYESWQLSPVFYNEPVNWMEYPKEDTYNFVLKNNVFKYIDNTGTISRHKSWLELPAEKVSGTYFEASAKMVSMFDPDDSDSFATGLSFVVEDEPTEALNRYNLNGQKVDANYKGVVIVNGRKIYNQ